MIPFQKLSVPVKIFIATLLIGTIFKIKHWPFAIEIIVCSCGLIGIFYFIQFWKSSNKKPIDYFKLISIELICLYWIVNTLHLPYKLPILIGAASMYLTTYIINFILPSK